MLYLEFWKSKQGIWFFDIHRLVFFTPLYVQIFKMQKYPTIATDYLGHIVGFCQKKQPENLIFMKKIQSSTKLYCGSRSTYIFIYVTFCQSVSISLQVWIDFYGYIWIWNFQCHILLFCFFSKEKKSPHLFQNTAPIAIFCRLLGKINLKNVSPKFWKSMSQMSGWLL